MRRSVVGVACGLAALTCLAATVAAEPVHQERIVGGGKANAAGWRFAVALEQKRSLICTGSLIGPTKVLTAAHCVKGGKRRQLSVFAGRASISPKRRAERIKVTRVVVDPKYNGRKDSSDFAVLSLAGAPDAQPIQLPTRAEGQMATDPGQIVRSAGWGTRSAWGFRTAQRVKSTKERVYHPRKCDRLYGKGRGFIGASMICALGKRVGRFRSRFRFRSTTCLGDSGGPVVANTPRGPATRRRRQRGHVSLRPRRAEHLCASFVSPRIHTRGLGSALIGYGGIVGPELRTCGRCRQKLPVSAFARRGNGHQSYCRSCQKEYDAGWYSANKARRQAKVREDRYAQAAWMNSLKEGKPCTDCGKVYPPYVMEWDHLPGTVKKLVLADVRRAAHARERILAELEKCELVCANCHRERTFGRARKRAA